MTRLVLVSGTTALDGFAPAPGDALVPLDDDAAAAIAARGWAGAALDLPPFGALRAAALVEAFDAARAILAALDADPGWRALLAYRGYDLRPMALKNLFFALEDLALARHVAGLAARTPHDAACLLDRDPARRRAVASVLPGISVGRAPVPWRVRLLPAARFARDRWRVWRAVRPKLAERRPVITFLDTPHRARIMARTLAALAPDHALHVARLKPFAWPPDLPVTPGQDYPWYAWSPTGAAVRIAQHVFGARVRTALDAFDLPDPGWLPPYLLRALQYNDVQRYANMLEGLEGLARAQQPALWITLEDLFALGKAAAAVGERYGVPALNVQHGIIGAYPYRTGVDVVGTFAAFGEASRTTLIERGADPSRIVVTGPVHYDDLLHLAPDRDALLRGAGLDPARPVVLFASQPARRLITPAAKRTAIRALAGGARRAGAQMVVKAHPLDDASLAVIVRELDPPLPVVTDDLYPWLLACDVLATISSTVVYEAALVRRPVLLLEWADNPDVAGYLAGGIALRPASPDGVGAALDRLLHDEATRAELRVRQADFVTRHLAGGDGRASERLAALARRLMGEA